MKSLKNVFMPLALIVVLQGCWDEDLFPGGGDVVPVTLEVNVVDAVTNAPVSGATVDLYHTLAGYVQETTPAATKTTDASGRVTFTKEELGDVGAKYVNISSGAKRNWAYTSATAVLNMTNGKTVMNTKVGDVLPQFISLAGNRFELTGYAGYDGVFSSTADECLLDDEIVFLKTGRVIGYDAGESCGASHFKGYSVAGFDWSSWALIENGAKITIKDLDPEYNSAAAVNATLTISGNGETVTIDYGGGYVATLSKVD